MADWNDNNGLQPVFRFAYVDVQFRDGVTYFYAQAGVFRWQVLGVDDDIVRWRLSEASVTRTPAQQADLQQRMEGLLRAIVDNADDFLSGVHAVPSHLIETARGLLKEL